MVEVREPFATVSELETRWRTLTPSERGTAEALLLDASQMVADEVGDVSQVSESTLRRITAGMVKRAMSGPGGIGIDSTQFGSGPFQESVKYSNPMGDLYLTKADRRALGLTGGKAFEVDLLPPDAGYGYGLEWLP